MDNNIAFSSLEAVRLNEHLQKALSEHLFLTCNYNPDIIFIPINDDARFILGVNNMYKFLHDAGICDILPNSFGKKYNKLVRISEIARYINALRTVFAHNVNQINGNVNERELVEEWCLDITGKELIDTEEEYKKVLGGIKIFGNESVRILNDFIKSINRFSDVEKHQTIKEWEKLIIRFYRRPSSRNILEGQLKMYYRTQVSSVKKNETMYIAETVKNMMTYKKDIDELQNTLDFLDSIKVSKVSSSFRAKRIEIENKIKDLKEKREANKEKVKSFSRSNSTGSYAYYNYYLEKILLETIENKILNNPNNTSLLPQNIVLEIIKEDFDNVQIYS